MDGADLTTPTTKARTTWATGLWAAFWSCQLATWFVHSRLWMTPWWRDALGGLFASTLVLGLLIAIARRFHARALAVVVVGTLVGQHEHMLGAWAKVIWRWRGFAP